MSRRDRYGLARKALRKRLDREVRAGRAACWRCRLPIHPDAEWHVGHSDDDASPVWMGPEHAYCNTSAGGRKGAERLQARRKQAMQELIMPGSWSRHWFGGYDPR